MADLQNYRRARRGYRGLYGIANKNDEITNVDLQSFLKKRGHDLQEKGKASRPLVEIKLKLRSDPVTNQI